MAMLQLSILFIINIELMHKKFLNTNPNSIKIACLVMIEIFIRKFLQD